MTDANQGNDTFVGAVKRGDVVAFKGPSYAVVTSGLVRGPDVEETAYVWRVLPDQLIVANKWQERYLRFVYNPIRRVFA